MNSFWDTRRLNGCPNSYVLNWSDEFYVCHRNHPRVTGEKAVPATFLYKAHTPCLVPGMALIPYWSCLCSFLFCFPHFYCTTHPKNSFLSFVTAENTPKPLMLWMSLWNLFHKWDVSILAFMQDIKNLYHLLTIAQDHSLTHSKVCISPRHPQSLLRHTISH